MEKAEEKKKRKQSTLDALGDSYDTTYGIKLIKKEEAVQYFGNYPDVKCKSLSFFGLPNHLQ
jgi:hypothetical protein